MEELPPGHVAAGRVATVWGVSGAVRVTPLVNRRETLAPGRSITVAGRRRTIESCRWHKGLAYLKLSGIDDRDAAFELRDRLLTLPKNELAPLGEGEYYRFQLIGLAVSTTAGVALGRLDDVITTGANDVYVVRGERGEVLVPATDDIVKAIDLKAARMVIEEVPGLIPEARAKTRRRR